MQTETTLKPNNMKTENEQEIELEQGEQDAIAMLYAIIETGMPEGTTVTPESLVKTSLAVHGYIKEVCTSVLRMHMIHTGQLKKKKK